MLRYHILLFALLFAGFHSAVQADIVVLKDGTRYEGKITLDTPDLIKIEVPITEKISETKTIGKDKIAEIAKTAPDDELFAKIQKMVPTASLLSTDDYRSMITTGPDAFLSSFESSKHKDKVVEIKKTLAEELDKVERGNIKVEGTWYSPQDRANFPKMIESQIVLYRMKQNVQGKNYLAFISAMRDFEKLEKDYFGTPAYVEGLELARKIVPALGRQLQQMRKDVDVKNAQWEANKNVLDAQARASVENARKREEAAYAAAVEADKKAKIRWTRVNPLSASNLDSYIQFASTEYRKLQGQDPGALREQAEILVEADELINEGKLDLAKLKLNEVAEIQKGSKRGGSGSSTYLGALNAKLSARVDERAAKKKALEQAKKSEALAAELKKNQTPALVVDGTKESDDGKGKGEAAEEKDDGMDDFAALANVTAKEEEKAPAPKKPEPKKKKTTSSSSNSASDRPRAESSGGGFPIGLIAPILTVLLIGAIVVMKVLGIGGGAKEEE